VLTPIGGAFNKTTLGNNFLKPAHSSEFEAGFNLEFGGSRYTIEYTYSKKNTKDQILLVALPSVVGYANRGFDLVFLVYRSGQKLTNIKHDDRISIAVAAEPADLHELRAVYAGAHAQEIEDEAERQEAWRQLMQRHSNLAGSQLPDSKEAVLMRARCKYVSMLDFTQSLGHRENFVVELAKHGMSKRDIVSNINFFMNVPILPDGELAIVDGASKPGDYVVLKAEMDVLCVISNCPQVNNPCNGFKPTPVRVMIWDT